MSDRRKSKISKLENQYNNKDICNNYCDENVEGSLV